MEEYIRVTAKTVEDALTEASIQLGITSDKLEYEVIEKGSSGFLGIGSKNAVIKVCKIVFCVVALKYSLDFQTLVLLVLNIFGNFIDLI